jgi:adenylate cyclase
MGMMIPIIRHHNAYLNKLLGDGIMYFFNAPYDDPLHHRHAVESALEMQSVMPAFNEELSKMDLPPLLMRMGLSTCDVIVGNAGPSDHSFNDYTALGDPVNLCSRLEGANKAFGTLILINQTLRDRAGEDILYRPVGSIQVVGKTHGIPAYEAMCWLSKATDKQKILSEQTGLLIDAFMKGQFEETLKIARDIDDQFGETKLTRLYASVCRKYIETPPEKFTGDISLSEK